MIKIVNERAEDLMQFNAEDVSTIVSVSRDWWYAVGSLYGFLDFVREHDNSDMEDYCDADTVDSIDEFEDMIRTETDFAYKKGYKLDSIGILEQYEEFREHFGKSPVFSKFYKDCLEISRQFKSILGDGLSFDRRSIMSDMKKVNELANLTQMAKNTCLEFAKADDMSATIFEVVKDGGLNVGDMKWDMKNYIK